MFARGSFDHWLLVTVLVLCGVGLVLLYSSSAWISEQHGHGAHQLFVNQAMKAALGLALLLLVSRIDYRHLAGRPTWIAWGVTTALLVFLAVPHPLKESVRHTDRWIFIGPFSVQPAEFARVTSLLLLAVLASRLKGQWEDRRRFLPILLVLGLPILLILFQPNFGTAVTLGLCGLTLLVLAGLPWSWLLGGGVALAGGAALLTLVYRYPMERVSLWIRSLGDFDQLSFQIQQGMIALGSGGVVGVGLGQSLQKRQFVPDPHTDLIFAIVGEELGFLGLLGLIMLFGLLLWRGFLIASRAPDFLGFLLAAGITVQLGFYFVINAGVVTGLLPVTGLPLPFVSYGGSALMANLVSVGLLLSVSRASGWMGARSQQRVMTLGFR